MINNPAAAAALNSPVRSISGRVELYSGSTLLDTYTHDGRLKGLTITRAAEDGKFFGFGVCQKLNVRLIDNARELDITTANAFRVYFDSQRVCPAFDVTEVNRDENTNALSITAYDAIYKATGHTVSEIALESYTLLEFAEACAALLGLSSVSILGLDGADAIFSLEYSEGANFDGTESIRDALNAIAEVTQTIYYIDHENNLVFKRLDNSAEDGGDTGGDDVLLPETEGAYNEDEGTFLIAGAPILTAGKIYTVKYNGVEYNTVALDTAVLGEAGGYILGDGYAVWGDAFGAASTGEPFVLVVFPAMGATVLMPLDGATSCTISISGSQGGTDTLSWDGNTDGLEMLEGILPVPMYKISDATPTAEELSGEGSIIVKDLTNGDFYESPLSQCMVMDDGAGYIGLMATFLKSDGLSVVDGLFTLFVFYSGNSLGVNAGLYVVNGTLDMDTGMLADENIIFSSLTIDGYAGFAGGGVCADTITWDGNTEGLVTNTNNPQFYKVSSAIPTLEDFANGGAVALFKNGIPGYAPFAASDIESNYRGVLNICSYAVVVIPYAGYDHSTAYGIFPEAGVYFHKYDDGFYVSLLKINGYTGFVPEDSSPAFTIDKSMYFTLNSGENKRLATICHVTELGDNVSASITETGTTQYLRNNPFLELREDVAEIIDAGLAAVGGLTINQFNCSWRGNYLLEIGDKISLITKDGGEVVSYLLDSTIEYNGTLAEVTQWHYVEDEAETADNPTSLGEALKQTYARVDKANKKIELVASDVDENSESIANLSINTNDISMAVKKFETNVNDSLENMSESVAELAAQVELTMSAEDVTLEIKKEIANGTGKVETNTGYKFDDEGLTISKSDSDISTQITEDGMAVSNKDDVVLTANHNGVKATDLHATTYLIIGANSRFEDYTKDGEARTGCFWIGG